MNRVYGLLIRELSYMQHLKGRTFSRLLCGPTHSIQSLAHRAVIAGLGKFFPEGGCTRFFSFEIQARRKSCGIM